MWDQATLIGTINLKAMKKTVESKTHLAHRKAAAKSYAKLDRKIKKFGKLKDVEKIIELIKYRNGCTTPAEFRFNQAAIDSIDNRLDLLVRDIRAFIKSAAIIK